MIYSVYGNIEANPLEAKFIADVEAISAEEAKKIVSKRVQEKLSVLAPTYFWAERRKFDFSVETWEEFKKSFKSLFLSSNIWTIDDYEDSPSEEVWFFGKGINIHIQPMLVDNHTGMCQVDIGCQMKNLGQIDDDTFRQLQLELNLVEYVLDLKKKWGSKRVEKSTSKEDQPRKSFTIDANDDYGVIFSKSDGFDLNGNWIEFKIDGEVVGKCRMSFDNESGCVFEIESEREFSIGKVLK